MNKPILINYTGRLGSGPLIAFEVAKALIENGELVVAVVSEYAENISSWETLPLLKLIKIKTYNNKFDFLINSILFKFINKHKLKRQLMEFDFKAVYCPMGTFWTKTINRLINGKIIYAIHDPKPHSGDEFLGKLMGKHKADIYIVHSKKFIDEVNNKYEKPTFYLPLGRHDSYKGKNNIGVGIEYSKDKTNFLFFGTISKYKGLNVLAKAFDKAYDNNPNISLTIAGYGDFSEYESEYNKLKNVTIINRWIKDEEVESIFNGPNIVTVLPYLDATQSGVLLVAYEYGSPVIGTKTGGLDEQIEDNKTGILVEPNNVDQLSKAMLTLASSPKLREEFSKEGHKRLEKLEWKNIARELIGLIDN